jgi:hypothetical protein
MIQINSLADIAILGGFNPNKYLSPIPFDFSQAQTFGFQTYSPIIYSQ